MHDSIAWICYSQRRKGNSSFLGSSFLHWRDFKTALKIWTRCSLIFHLPVLGMFNSLGAIARKKMSHSLSDLDRSRLMYFNDISYFQGSGDWPGSAGCWPGSRPGLGSCAPVVAVPERMQALAGTPWHLQPRRHQHQLSLSLNLLHEPRHRELGAAWMASPGSTWNSLCCSRHFHVGTLQTGLY